MENEIIVKESNSLDVADSLKGLGMIQQFIAKSMKENQDYGIIPGCKKPSLFKSGAEKLEFFGGLYHEYECLANIEKWEDAFFYYRYKCKVYRKKDNVLVAESIGSCNSKEQKYLKQDAYSLVNTIDKMAQKRAYVSAIISAMRVSSDYTCDVEDMPEETVQKPQQNNKFVCASCNVEISQSIAEFSRNKFKRQLCMDCQKKQ